MERTCSKDEQTIQLLSVEESESNSPEIRLQRPQSCLNKYWKILMITPLLVLLLLLTYWITVKGIAAGGQTGPAENHSTHFPSNNTSSAVNDSIEPEVAEQPDGCHVGLYSLAKIQMHDFDTTGASESRVDPLEVHHTGQLVSHEEVPGQSLRATILVEEKPIHVKGGSSFVAFIGGNHSTSIGFFTDNKNGTYTICCPLPPECVNITVRLYSFDYSAYKAVESLDGQFANDVGIRTAYQTRLCPSRSSVDAGMSHIPPYCIHKDVSMKPGSWTQINQLWFWKSHEENCLVPDMSRNWIPCATKTHGIRIFGDATAHWYSYYVSEFLKSRPANPLFDQTVKFTYTQSCKDIHTSLFGIQTVPRKTTYVVLQCGSNTFYEQGYNALQREITDLFAKAKEVREISPNLRFVFLLSALKQQVSKSASSEYTELNMFSSAAINSWIADQAKINGVSVFDDMYPKTMGLGHIGSISEPLTNLFMYHMCNVN